MLDKLLNRLQGEAKKYSRAAIETPVDKTEFEYGTHHGYVKALNHVEQWIQELLEAEEGDDKE